MKKGRVKTTKRAPSGISPIKRCVICGTTENIHMHEIFYGSANRKKSIEDGCWCYLCAGHHNMTDFGVHFDKNLDLELKRLCQEWWEQTHGTREEFIRRYGRNYL